mmetsp:Transcript_100589/g.313555  ORF Transcript_100589/g.313555 Transcript_100589/m.313555 type:complete len:214 (-) Transcript_100589:569-1210(-)
MVLLRRRGRSLTACRPRGARHEPLHISRHRVLQDRRADGVPDLRPRDSRRRDLCSMGRIARAGTPQQAGHRVGVLTACAARRLRHRSLPPGRAPPQRPVADEGTACPGEADGLRLRAHPARVRPAVPARPPEPPLPLVGRGHLRLRLPPRQQASLHRPVPLPPRPPARQVGEGDHPHGQRFAHRLPRVCLLGEVWPGGHDAYRCRPGCRHHST